LQSAERFSDIGKRGDDQLQLLDASMICVNAGCDDRALRRVVDVRDRDFDVSDRHAEAIGCWTFSVDYL
jgi:hypothetical protein